MASARSDSDNLAGLIHLCVATFDTELVHATTQMFDPSLAAVVGKLEQPELQMSSGIPADTFNDGCLGKPGI